MNTSSAWQLAALGAILLIAIVFAVRRMRDPGPTNIGEQMAQMAREAVQYARERGVTLDYSRDSVEQVESLLDELSKQWQAGDLLEQTVHAHALRFGAYLGEILRREYGGHWTRDHEVAGPNSLPIHWGGGQSFPVGWCGKRILNGEEDNVAFKFRVLTSQDGRAEFDALAEGAGE